MDASKLENERAFLQKIGQRIKKIRKKRNLSQQDFGEKISLGRASVSSYEQGDGSFGALTLMKIANLGGISLDQLITGSNSPYAVPMNTDKHLKKILDRWEQFSERQKEEATTNILRTQPEWELKSAIESGEYGEPNTRELYAFIEVDAGRSVGYTFVKDSTVTGVIEADYLLGELTEEEVWELCREAAVTKIKLKLAAFDEEKATRELNADIRARNIMKKYMHEVPDK